MEDDKESTDAGTYVFLKKMGLKDSAIFTLIYNYFLCFLFSESVDTERDLGSVQEV